MGMPSPAHERNNLMNLNNRKFKLPNTMRKNPMHQNILKSEWLSSSSAEKDLEILVDTLHVNEPAMCP